MSTGIKILVVDDSALMRRALTSTLSEIVGAEIRAVRNGAEALSTIEAWSPDVVTLDVNMPVMDGLTCLSEIMTRFPTPVVMVSSITSKDSEATLEALSMGAVDIIEKPDGTVSKRLDAIGGAIRRTVKTAARARIPSVRARGPARAPKPATPAPKTRAPSARAPRPVGAGTQSADRIVLIGISTGGPNALEQLIPELPGDCPVPIVVAQHMPGNFTSSFARRLDERSAVKVVEASRAQPLEPGTAYIIHGGGDGLVQQRLGRPIIQPVSPDSNFAWHPSVDRLVASTMKVYDPSKVLGVLMTGMGDDGAETMAELKSRGGHTIAESEQTAIVYGMPRELVERDGATEVVELPRIHRRITSWVGRGR